MRRILFLSLLILTSARLFAQQPVIISTQDIDLVYKVGEDGRLYQSYFGPKLANEQEYALVPQGYEAYITHGMEDYFEPALHIVHNDHNPSTLLKYCSHSSREISEGVSETLITLKDDKYPVTVNLYYIAYKQQNLIKTYTEISHKEKKPVSLEKYASSMLHFNSSEYYLTQFAGDWGTEVQMKEQKLEFGKKILDSKLGSRANMFCSPFFQLSLDKSASESEGAVIAGTIGWTGNFYFVFEQNQEGSLRVISGINPYASQYELQPGEVFRTPDFYFTYSTNGRGEASRNFHDWARKYQVKQGGEDRLTLLNNWEATYFKFDENVLDKLIADAANLGVDMFLLDDGWFGTKYPRSSDHQGLGDWDETPDKLPNGIAHLCQTAKKNGIRFGLWIEPEMLNPKSELFEKHPDWAILLPNRDPYYFRNQLVLDLSNPKVQDYVYGIVDNLMTKYPEIAFFKWDCNSPITNIYSPYLKEKQNHLYIEHVRGLYNILNRINDKYPDLKMMLCSGGGGRTDYEALKYFTEFWCSDNTDPEERLYIQWGYSQFFPVKTMCAHITSWNRKSSIKFRTEVAMMGKMGFDIKLTDMNEDEIEYCKSAVKKYNELKPVILDGQQYRLVSPYESDHSATMYISEKNDKAVLFSFDIHPRYTEIQQPLRLQGLDPAKMYKLQEVNLMPGKTSRFKANGKVFSGDFLMKYGIEVFTGSHLNSRVIEIIAQ